MDLCYQKNHLLNINSLQPHSQGLSSYRLALAPGGKMRDPGNEVELFMDVLTNSLWVWGSLTQTFFSFLRELRLLSTTGVFTNWPQCSWCPNLLAFSSLCSAVSWQSIRIFFSGDKFCFVVFWRLFFCNRLEFLLKNSSHRRIKNRLNQILLS